MPLIILTGLPTSGKTTRAKQLHAYLSSRITPSSSSSSPPPPPNSNPNTNPTVAPQIQPPKYSLHLISDTTLSIPRSVYDLSPENLPAHVRSANASEKDARAAVYAAVKRVLSPRDIVILDGLNYIKGWRYQLFCEAKNVSTPSCVVQVGCTVERARAVNERRLQRRREGSGGRRRVEGRDGEADVVKDGEGPEEGNDGKVREEEEDNDEEEPYEPSNWENVVFRYEEPNPMTRWDSPLFTLVWEDDEAQTRAVFDKIWDTIAGEGRKTVKPNQSTVQRDKDPGGDYLYVLERETQDIVKRILERQSDDGGGEVTLPRINDPSDGQVREDLVVSLPGKKVGLPQLQRYRRAFVALNRGGIGLEAVGKLAAERLRESFVGYLNDAFEKDG
ncbi:chromatin associated protein KTI12 [Parathielavia appendiculata]|uniref:Chromatin associated protein KTI12 n=1 Tax=Parathielavia appendiculata TaxID=2587402 RepID=A0AAN6U012_9PEZI|nr:chromatin associated protein KTI12 [Parathielavia appendiculata]